MPTDVAHERSRCPHTHAHTMVARNGTKRTPQQRDVCGLVKWVASCKHEHANTNTPTKHEHEHAPLFRTKHEHTQNTEQNTNTEHPNTNTRFRTPEKTKQKPEHEHAFPNARTPFGANPGKTSLHLGRAWIHPWILAMNGSMDEHEHMAMSILFFTPQSIIKNLITHKMRKIGILKKMEN